jgi:hypothetical protein
MTNSRLLVVLDNRRGASWLLPLLRAFNERHLRLPWLKDRTVVIGFAAPLGRAGRRRRATKSEVGYEPIISAAGVWC